MSSFNVVNYSLRPNKSIQRSLVFEGISLLQERLALDNMAYLGFGSIWFTDFLTAHRSLQINDMVSMESDEIGYRRARFNQPFRTVRIQHGHSSALLPNLIDDPQFANRPWLLWLDFDGTLDEESIEDVRWAMENLPPDSIFLTTFNALAHKYGKPNQRVERLRAILGEVVPDELTTDDCQEGRLENALARYTLAYMTASVAEIARPGGFVPAFNIRYRDGAPMVTVGGILPGRGSAAAARAAVAEAGWPCLLDEEIGAPLLTLKEASVLQSQLPHINDLSRVDIQNLGFDLEEDQIRSFQRYYRYYPTFAQVLA